MINITLLHDQAPVFPHPANALDDPNGLLAIGGNLQPDTLLSAYRQGIFPWFSEGEPLLWWSPNQRSVIFPEDFHASRSLRKLYRQKKYQITFNQAFEDVINACSEPRQYEAETWITDSMKQAYLNLHKLNQAHSVEVWDDNKMVGGLYGVQVGAVFCGESMFSRAPNGSKLALLSLIKQQPDIQLIDCQIPNAHLESLGAVEITREEFLERIDKLSAMDSAWRV